MLMRSARIISGTSVDIQSIYLERAERSQKFARRQPAKMSIFHFCTPSTTLLPFFWFPDAVSTRNISASDFWFAASDVATACRRSASDVFSAERRSSASCFTSISRRRTSHVKKTFVPPAVDPTTTSKTQLVKPRVKALLCSVIQLLAPVSDVASPSREVGWAGS